MGIEQLKNKILAHVELKLEPSDRVPPHIMFHTFCGKRFKMTPYCELPFGAWLEDQCGDFRDLQLYPILLAEEVSNTNHKQNGLTKHWTFYKLSTNKGSITLRWMCECANGYDLCWGDYAIGVDFYELKN